ncbi:MAG: TIGR03087 family PEP-CTERM/XrtA system glycosyltransferase [Planctomycetes bacterium]|nr:TIGR03087 family PEP-CTERM/XrtA system glycosyltransferase [Planctomycetota bacterium]
MRILFLSQRVPFPPNRGDKITTSKLIERMRRRHSVRCVAFSHGPEDDEGARELEDMGVSIRTVPYHDLYARVLAAPLLFTSKPLTLGAYGSSELQRIVDEEIAQADLAYAYSSSMGAFLERHATKPRVMHFGELDSDKWRQYAERSALPMSWVYAREQRTLLEFERRVARSFSENVVCTPLEQRVFQQQIPGASSVVLRNGVDLERFHPRANEVLEGELVFTGVMNYLPNAEGCAWFAREILPRIRAQRPQVRFSIVGSSPSREVERLAELPGVRVTGSVPDTREYLRHAAVAVAPLRIARGIQNKVLEALAMGLPVVGTTPATQGVEGSAGRDYLVADEPEAFAAAVLQLLAEPAHARELAAAGRSFVERNYDWEKVFAPLDGLLERCAAPRSKNG